MKDKEKEKIVINKNFWRVSIQSETSGGEIIY